MYTCIVHVNPNIYSGVFLYSEMSFNESSHCPQITFYLFIYLSIYQMTIQVFQTVDLTTDI